MSKLQLFFIVMYDLNAYHIIIIIIYLIDCGITGNIHGGERIRRVVARSVNYVLRLPGSFHAFHFGRLTH